MKTNKFEDLLKSIKPSYKVNYEHKHSLRHKLLNSERFSRKRIIRNNIMVAGSLALIIWLIIIFNRNIFTTDFNSNDLFERMKVNYAGYFADNKLNYINGDVTIFGRNGTQLNFEAKRIIDYKNNNYRLTILDKETDKILDDYIILDNKIFRTPIPNLEVINSYYSTFISESDQLKKRILIEKDSNAYNVKLKNNNLPSLDSEPAFLVFRNNYNGNLELKTKDENQIQIEKEFDLLETLKETPLDIINKIDSKLINIKNIYYDENIKDYIAVVEITSMLKKNERMRLFRLVPGLKDSLEQNISEEQRLSKSDSILKALFNNQTDSAFRKFKDDFFNAEHIDNNKINKIQTLIITQKKGEILELKTYLNKGGKSVTLSSVKFIVENTIPKNNSYFDVKENHFELTYVTK